MQKFLMIASASVLILSCNSQNSSTNSTEMKTDSTQATETSQTNDGWMSLFDGKTTAGWHKYGGGPVGSGWKIQDSAIYLDTTVKINGKRDGGDIVTAEEFENFDLKLEWKIAKNGNSGIMFCVHEDTTKYKAPYETGPEMQVLDNDGHPDGKIKKHRAGDLYDLISCSRETVRPVGEWNQVEIKLLNGKLDFYLNGENVVSTTMWDDSWNKLVAGSKFKTMPGFATFKKGHIDLQDHDCMVWYRNIMIKKL
jgi:hypothetical protein